jgi:hypothetical protein
MPGWARRVLPRLCLLLGLLLLTRHLAMEGPRARHLAMEGPRARHLAMEGPRDGQEHGGSGSNTSRGEPPLILLWNNYQEDRSGLYRTIFHRCGRGITHCGGHQIEIALCTKILIFVCLSQM